MTRGNFDALYSSSQYYYMCRAELRMQHNIDSATSLV